jgi:GcrA cell cycle regulator
MVGAMIMFANDPTWTAERVDLLKSRLEAGFTCREIAQEIGVSRNAVIGKISRLHLPPRRHASERRSERKDGPNAPPRRGVSQRRVLLALHATPQPLADEAPIHNGHCCSLLELTKDKCRWPIDDPGAVEFRFCGNKPVEGLPYCAGHARLAYRPPSR